MTADGAALGLNALGLTDEAGALGLIRLGPVAAGAEPGIGTKTPWPIAACPRVRAARAAARANKCLEVGGMAPTREAACFRRLPQPELTLSCKTVQSSPEAGRVLRICCPVYTPR